MASRGHDMASLAPVNIPSHTSSDSGSVRMIGRVQYHLRRCPAQYNHLLCSCITNGTISTVPMQIELPPATKVTKPATHWLSHTAAASQKQNIIFT